MPFKETISGLFNFARTERIGYATLGLIILLLLTIRLTMIAWVRPAQTDPARAARMKDAYLAWKAAQPGDAGAAESPGASVEAVLFAFDPNTLDSAGFIRLGMPARAVKGLLNWRRKGKQFYKPEDLKPLYNLPPETYARLEPYIQISNQPSAQSAAGNYANAWPQIPKIIDLNTTDSATLDRGISGIGATLAHNIIARRAALGGFLRHDQLLEVYKFPDTTFQKMKERLHINPAAVKKVVLNTATLDRLTIHPYIGEKVGRNILMFREGIGRYEHIEQLRQVPLMTEEIYRKIAPYCSVE